MRKIKFSGHSDDVFQYEDSHGGGDESYGSPAAFKLSRGSDELLVLATYTNQGCWSVGLCISDEGKQLPPWSTEFGQEGYTTTLTIAVPENAKIEAIR